jgi:hypothetical protein
MSAEELISIRAFGGGEDYSKYQDLINGRNHYFKPLPLSTKRFINEDFRCRINGDSECSALFPKKPNLACHLPDDYSVKPFKCRKRGDNDCLGAYPCHNNENEYCENPNECPVKPLINKSFPTDWNNVYFIDGFENEVIIINSGGVELIINESFYLAQNYFNTNQTNPLSLFEKLYESTTLERYSHHRSLDEFINFIRTSYIYFGSSSKGLVIPIYNTLLSEYETIQGGFFHFMIGHHTDFQKFYMKNNLSSKSFFKEETTFEMILFLLLRLYFSRDILLETKPYDMQGHCGKIQLIRNIYSLTLNLQNGDTKFKLVTEYNPITQEEYIVTFFPRW